MAHQGEQSDDCTNDSEEVGGDEDEGDDGDEDEEEDGDKDEDDENQEQAAFENFLLTLSKRFDEARKV